MNRNTTRALSRPPIEPLEPRRMLNAADLDPAFGDGDGLAVQPVPGGHLYGNGIVMQSNGRVIVGGTRYNSTTREDVALVRFNVNGTTDYTFNNNTGIVIGDVASRDNRFFSMVVQPDDKILVAAMDLNPSIITNEPARFVIWRYNANGTPDTGFGTSGRVLLDNFVAGKTNHWPRLALQPDGKIIVAGGASHTNFVAARLNTDGQLDSTFGGGDGKVLASPTGSSIYPNDVAVAPDGDIIVIGDALEIYPDDSAKILFAAVRWDSDGNLDEEFGGGDGMALFPVLDAAHGTAESIAVQADGKILLGGTKFAGGQAYDFALLRISDAGVPDTSFSGDGWQVTNLSMDDRIMDLQIVDGGKILAVGRSYSTASRLSGSASIVRYNSNGNLDTTFGDNGKLLTKFALPNAEIHGVVRRPSGEYVLGGFWENQATFANEWIAAQLLGDNAPAPINASVAGKIFNDVDADGFRDAAEAGLANWKVFIDADKDGVLDPGEKTATSDAAGNYKFADLAPGSYRVRVVQQATWRRTKPTAAWYDYNLVAGQDVTVADFGQSQSVQITGNLFEDKDGDGIKDAGEGPLSEWWLYLDANKNGKFDTGERRAMTDAAGNYKFNPLPAGSYRVREDILTSGWRISTPSSGYHDVTLAAGGSASGKNFGNTKNVLISGTLWNDLDADAVKDAGEGGLAGWKVFIDANKNGLLDTGEKTATTDASGNYKFTALRAGSYRIREVLQAGWRKTTAASWYDLTLPSGGSATGKNFGNTQKILISGNVFNDLNGDHLKSAGEGGLAGWRIFVDKDNDGVYDIGESNVLSDASGNWSFKQLLAGTYKLRIVQQTGWTRTTPTSGYHSVTLASGASATGKLFGEKKLA
ncbi:MAG: hypothetical protein QOF78_263 [Phycisphaerales bacterium]|nr:hypothetical protein [Phycisphaerales bacterium]